MITSLTRSNSPSVDGLQHLFEYIYELNQSEPPSAPLDQLLQGTHDLSNTLSELLNHLVSALGEGEAGAPKRLPLAIDAATDSITTLKQLMLVLHHMKRIQNGAGTSRVPAPK